MRLTPAELRAHQRRKVEALRAQITALEARGDHADAEAVRRVLRRMRGRWRGNLKAPAGRLRAVPRLVELSS